MNKKNIERFASVMSDRMKQTSNAAVPTVAEFATVNSDLSITPDSLGMPVPRAEYKINIMLSGLYHTAYETVPFTSGSHGGHEGGDGAHSHGNGLHRHEMPEGYRGLKPGDRVLVIWAGTEPVVVAIVA